MDYYIVRIYRRDESEEQNMTGLVETVGHDQVSVFNNREELWCILGGMASRVSPALGSRLSQAKTDHNNKITAKGKRAKA